MRILLTAFLFCATVCRGANLVSDNFSGTFNGAGTISNAAAAITATNAPNGTNLNSLTFVNDQYARTVQPNEFTNYLLLNAPSIEKSVADVQPTPLTYISLHPPNENGTYVSNLVATILTNGLFAAGINELSFDFPQYTTNRDISGNLIWVTNYNDAYSSFSNMVSVLAGQGIRTDFRLPYTSTLGGLGELGTDASHVVNDIGTFSSIGIWGMWVDGSSYGGNSDVQYSINQYISSANRKLQKPLFLIYSWIDPGQGTPYFFPDMASMGNGWNGVAQPSSGTTVVDTVHSIVDILQTIPYISRGHFPYAEALTSSDINNQIAAETLACLTPLHLDFFELTQITPSPTQIAVATNGLFLSILRDSLCAAGSVDFSNANQFVMSRRLSNSRFATGMVNTTNTSQTYTKTWASMGIKPTSYCLVQNVLGNNGVTTDIGYYTNSFTLTNSSNSTLILFTESEGLLPITFAGQNNMTGSVVTASSGITMTVGQTNTPTLIDNNTFTGNNTFNGTSTNGLGNNDATIIRSSTGRGIHFNGNADPTDNFYISVNGVGEYWTSLNSRPGSNIADKDAPFWGTIISDSDDSMRIYHSVAVGAGGSLIYVLFERIANTGVATFPVGVAGPGSGLTGLNPTNLTGGTTLPALNGSLLTNIQSSAIANPKSSVVAPVTVGASPFNFTNTTDSRLEVHLTGNGTAYSVSKMGVPVYGSLNSNDYVLLQPTNTMAITWSVAAPTMNTNSW